MSDSVRDTTLLFAGGNGNGESRTHEEQLDIEASLEVLTDGQHELERQVRVLTQVVKDHKEFAQTKLVAIELALERLVTLMGAKS